MQQRLQRVLVFIILKGFTGLMGYYVCDVNSIVGASLEKYPRAPKVHVYGA
jgi:hypothetical protein